MPYFRSINSYQFKTSLKLSYFCKKKNQIFRVGEELASGGWGRSSQTHQTTPPPLQISGYALDTRHVLLMLPSFRILQREVIELAKQQPLSIVTKWYCYLIQITFCCLLYIMKGDTTKFRPGCTILGGATGLV